MLKGFYRVAAAVPEIRVADPKFNAKGILRLYERACAAGAAVMVSPELALTGCTCGDLFEHRVLIEAAEEALNQLVRATDSQRTALAVGLPVADGGRLYDAVAVLQEGRIIGVTARKSLPNVRGEVSARHFCPAPPAETVVKLCGQSVLLGAELVYDGGNGLCFGIEVSDDALSMVPPASTMAAGDATLILNAYSGCEVAGYGDWLRGMVSGQSARYGCAYALAAAGCGESTTDAVYGGRAVIAENGAVLAERDDFSSTERIVFSEFSPSWMTHQRRSRSAFNCDINDLAEATRLTLPSELPSCGSFKYRKFSQTPFVPAAGEPLRKRCAEILSIQAAGLAQRVRHTCSSRLVVGLSGGLDSTLALMVCVKCCELLGQPKSMICAVTMPGMGTTGRTYDNACGMARLVGAELREIPIAAAVKQHFADIGHDPEKLDVVYENSQARERTQILMDVANGIGGLVVGTGDLSEIALGWSTYNGDHMSMYAVNCDVPKTLIRWMVEYCADNASPKLAKLLRDVNATPVSPELLPGGAQTQKTEGILGSYDLHDFFLYYFVRHGETPSNLLALAKCAFKGTFKDDEIVKGLELFVRRFFGQQFKRSCVPDGPKVGTVALSPRGEWMMPSDASREVWK